MKITIAYTAVTNGPLTADYASRFVASYQQFPPGAEHDLIVCCNGGALTTDTTLIFATLNARFFTRTNNGWDIGAYIDAANGPARGCDMLLCLGESNYFFRPGWLARLVEAWLKYGAGMYSPYSSNAVRAHMNTTAFCCPPILLTQYPARVIDRKSRYEFEHGEQSFWRQTAKRGMPVRMVTWDGEWEPRAWRLPQNILWRGDQSNCLMHCNHSDRYEKADYKTKVNWAASADRPYR